MALTEDTEAIECTECGEAIYDFNGSPRCTFDYIPLTHQLRLQVANKQRAELFEKYPRECEENFKVSGVMTDIWNGNLVKHLRSKTVEAGAPILTRKEDIALMLSSDGSKVFKTRSAFHIWPIILTIANVPPKDRVKRENQILVGLVPGPGQPTCMDTFLRPLINELKALEKGISAWNGFQLQEVNQRAYLITVGADTKGRELLMGTTGINSYNYCFYCKARGVHSTGTRGGHIYCPFEVPPDVPAEAKTHKFQKFKRLNPNKLPLKNDKEWREVAWKAFEQNNPNYGKAHGISR
jgi:hypothetical protein